MKKINNILKKLDIKPHRYAQSGKVYLVESNEEKYIIKRNDNPIYNYLNQRSFGYYPETVIEDGYEIAKFEDEIEIPNEQKILDLVSLIGLLHSKTTHYKPITEYDHKDTYEDLKGNIEYLKEHYNNIMNAIESEIFMKPSSYLLARHITQINNMLNYCENNVEEWYKKIQDKNKIRVVTLHNNLALDHYINNKLISWNKAKTGSPIFDLYKLYKRTYSEYVWEEVLKKYIRSYPLFEEELDLFYLMISIPNNLELKENEYDNVKTINDQLEYMETTGNFIETMKKTSI
jgi:hypothetical protein